MSARVTMRGITMRFGDVVALDNVDLTVDSGSIHAVVGENGAGKTTLMRILYGAYRPTSGQILLGDSEQKFGSSKEAIEAGVGMVSQHYAIIPELTCLQNLILGSEPSWNFDLTAMKSRAQELAQEMGFQFDWEASAEGLGPAGSQKLEILKLLWRNSEIMILDEPTAMLSPADSDALFESLKLLSARGKTIILVTHRLPEVLQFCSSVTVLRGGKLIESRPVADLSAAHLAELIVGHEVAEIAYGERTEASSCMLKVSKLTVLGERGDEAVRSASFSLNAGEVVGIAGVDGNGQRELFQALIGVRRVTSGEIIFADRPLQKLTTAERILAGVRLIAEDRHDEAVIEDWSLVLNGMLGFQRFPRFSRGAWIDLTHAETEAQRMAERFSTRHGGLELPMESLSGGNQQRFVVARELSCDPKLILAFQPTRGLDIEATRQVYKAIHSSCAEGACAIVVSFDLDELLAHCHRILVMSHGETMVASALDRGEIGRMMVGVGT